MEMTSSIKESPEFASICSFIELFGEQLNVALSHNQLAKFLEVTDAGNVPKVWIDVHRRLLTRAKYHCSSDKWQAALRKCLCSALGAHSDLLAAISGADYFSVSALDRARILISLFDCQFDRNNKFKEKINLRLVGDLRSLPFGSDIHGCVYWLFVDSDVSVLMYRENAEEESFKIVAESIEGLHKLRTELMDVDCDNVILSKLYLETSPSDEIDNSRNQSPVLDNVSNANEKATNNVEPIKKEDNELSNCVKKENSEISPEICTKSENLTNDPIYESKVNDQIDNEIVKTEDNIPILDNVDQMKSEKESESNKEVENNCKTPEKVKKKVGRKPKDSSPVILDESLVNTGLRRSERKRKPVNLFTIAYTDSCKKIKSDAQKTEINERTKIKSDKVHKKVKEKRKKGRPRKSSDLLNYTPVKEKKKTKKNKAKHKKGRGHKKHISKHPWENAESSDEYNDLDDDDDVYSNEESEKSINIKDLWDDKPESDFDVGNISCSSDEETSKARGRNYFRQKSIKKKEQEIDDKPCQICLKNNIPEMILLCDECDLGHHAMCLRPSLMIIPEGDWFCPKCQHKRLLNKLTEKIAELEKSMVKNNAKIRMQERLNFVNISMSNILSKNQERKRSRKLSCESEIGSQSECNSSQSLSSSSGTCDSSDNSSESDSRPHARYKFRENSRKDNTKYNFEEIDKIFDDALEHDEKYKLMKKEHENREQQTEDSHEEESEPEYDYSGIEPRKKSSGKDMANIIDEEKPPTKSYSRKKRSKYDSDNDEFEDDTKDVDFKISDQSDSEFDDDECIEEGTNCSDDDWISSKKRSTRRSMKKKKKNRHKSEHLGFLSRPKRNATRNINYRNMLGEEDEDDSELNEQSPEYESSEDDTKPPPVVSRKKDRQTGRLKKRIISDSEYEEENSKSESIADSGSTEKLETVKRKQKFKPDLNSDSDSETQTQSKIPKIDNDDSISNDCPVTGNPPVAPVITSFPPLKPSINYPPLGILNPMRAKGDEDNDIENEVESETECDLTICLNNQDLSNNQNIAPKP